MLSRLVDIRAGEWRRAVLACASLLLVIAAYTVVKSVRDALFLSKFGITQLSFIAIGLALATGFVISIYLRATARFPRNLLIGGTNVVIAGSLVLIWLGLFVPQLTALLPWVLYIWSSIFGVFIVMQFWLLANDLFDPREGKRLFGFVGAGAILGGIIGGFVSRALAGLLGSSNLLLLAAGMLLLEVVLVFMVWPLRRRDEAPPPRRGRMEPRKITGGLSALQQNRVVRLVAAALLLSTMATTLLDWQFKGITKAAYAGRTDEMAAFFGSLYAYLSVASFLVQTLVTSAILRRFGVRVGLMALPVSLLGGSGLILISAAIPGASRLVAASAAKVAEGGLRFSLDKASMELMWLPVPRDVKEKGKAFVDTVVDRFGTGLTGFVWLALAALGLGSPERIHMVSIAVGGLVVVWLAVLVNARSAYIGALRAVLARRSLDTGGLRQKVVNVEARSSILGTLESDDPREVCFALYLLEEIQGELPDLKAPLAHPDPTVRVEVLHLLTRAADARQRAAAVPSLTHEAAAVREAAVLYLRSTAPAAGDRIMERIEAAGGVDRAVLDVIRLGLPAHAMAAASELRQMLESGGETERRVEVLQLLAGAPREMAAALIAPHLRDPDPRVVAAAVRAAGRARCAALSSDACKLLSDPGMRRAAAEALHEMGEAALAALLVYVQDGEAPTLSRIRAVQIVGACGRAEPAGVLLDLLDAADPALAHRALRALNRLRTTAGLVLGADQLADINRRIHAELEALYRDLCFLGRGSWAELREAGRPGGLVERSIAQQASRRVERIFRLHGLEYTPRDVYSSYLGVRSPIKTVRASSIELLDNLLPKAQTARLLPVLESAGVERFVAAAREVGIPGPEPRGDALRRLMRGSDEVMCLVAVWTVGVERLTDLRDALTDLESEASGVVLAEVQRALARMDAESFKEPIMGLTTIEKALKLQKADVLQEASTDDLAHIAQIATEEEYGPGEAIYSEGDAPDALFVVISGAVRLHRGEAQIAVLGENETFGGWALVDESPRVASATAQDRATVLRVGRVDFQELLADRVDIVQAVFKAMVDRLRNLADLANNP